MEKVNFMIIYKLITEKFKYRYAFPLSMKRVGYLHIM